MDKDYFNKLLSKAETLELNDGERKKAPSGSFIQLPCGNTHYQMEGEGEVCVLVHGYATPYHIYDKVYNTLLKEGYKVIRYDLMGRGLSERVDTDYTPDFFARQLHELTQALIGDEQFYLFGTSMGGSVTTAFVKNYPGRAKKLILLAPAGMDTFKPPFYMTLCKIPGFGKWLFGKIGTRSLLNGCAKEMKYSLNEVDYFMEQFAYCAQYKNFVRSTFSSLLNTILRTDITIKGYEAVANQKLPLLVIWGTDDKTMPYYQAERMKEVCPQVQLVTYEGSGHIFVYDEGERTMSDVMKFIRE